MIENTLICDLYIKYCVFGCMNCVLFAEAFPGFFLSGADSSFREREINLCPPPIYFCPMEHNTQEGIGRIS